MTCKRCNGRGETYGENFVSCGDTEGGYDRCDPCKGTGEVLCECGSPADGVSPLGTPECVTCLAVPLMAADVAVSAQWQSDRPAEFRAFSEAKD